MAKQNVKQSLLLASVLVVVVVGGFFISLPFLVRPAFLERIVREKVEKQTGYAPSFERFNLSLFPVPVIHFWSFALKSSGDKNTAFLNAGEASFRPSLISLALGKLELDQISLRNADIHIPFGLENGKTRRDLLIENISADFFNLHSEKPIRYKIKGGFFGGSENLILTGTVQTDFKQFRPHDFALDLQMKGNNISLARLAQWWGSLPLAVQKGNTEFTAKISKAQNAAEIDANALIKFDNFVYGLKQNGKNQTTSTAANYESKFNLKYDLEKNLLIVKDGSVTAPFGGPFQVNGKWSPAQNIIEEFFIKSEALRLEALPQYILPLEPLLPLNLGFSGESRLDFFVKGHSKLLTMRLRVDSTEATLTYSKYFSKSSGSPFVFRSDMELKEGNVLNGDFSVEFEKASLKGSVVQMDLSAKRGELTLITNKFSVNGWERFFPPLKQLALSGDLKFLINMKGNFNQPGELVTADNVTFDHIQMKAPNGAEIRNLSGTVDFSPMDSELKDVVCEIGSSKVLAQGKMFLRPATRWLIDLSAPELNVRDLVKNAKGLSEAIQLDELKWDWKPIENAAAFIREGETFKNFQAQIAYGQNRLVFPAVQIEAYDGTVSGKAILNFSKEAPSTSIDLELDKLSLARMNDPAKSSLVDGNLFGTVALTNGGLFDGQWLDRLKGQGTVAVTNGEFHTLDLLGGLGQVAELAKLNQYQSGTTKFHDLRGKFSVGNKKIETKDLFLVSDDFQVEIPGEIDFNGNLNFRLSIFLMPQLARKFSSEIKDNERLGPIPLLLVGTVQNPSIKKDAVLLQTFLDYFIRAQFSKIASRPSPVNSAPVDQGKKAAEEPTKDMKQALVESGFNLLEQFLSPEKKGEKTAS